MNSKSQNYYCPVCFTELTAEPWINGSPSDDMICSECGLQYGNQDAVRLMGNNDKTINVYSVLMENYIFKNIDNHDKIRKLASRIIELTLKL